MLLKRLLPFALTLAIGVALAGLASFVNSPARRASDSSRHEIRSKTWLFIHDLPAPNYTEQEAIEKKALRAQRLQATLNADGRVSYVVPIESASLDESRRGFMDDAVEAAERIRFTPATEDGESIPLHVTIDYQCSDYHFAHKRMFRCFASIVEVERDWRTVYE